MAMLEKKGYLERIKKATPKATMPDHPRHNGIKMQAHHLTSAKGIDDTTKSDDLRQLGYNINHIKNLVFIPSTLQGACHLEVQLHRGDHKKDDPFGSDDPEAADTDESHPKGYHVDVKEYVKKLFLKYDICKMKTDEVQDKMNKISKKLLKQINNYELHLTSISATFDEGANGCMGIDNVPKENKHYDEVRATPCPINRDHFNSQGMGQKKENITIEKKQHKLRIGK